MTRPRYTRYALRLNAPAVRGEAPVGARPTAAPSPAPTGPPPEAAPAAPADDWSGAAPPAPAPDGQAVDYLDPAAVDDVLALQPAGWQEEDGGRTLVFWLEEGAEADGCVARSLRRLGAHGRLEVAREAPGWEDAWRRFHKPHVIGRVYVRPPWYPARDDLLDVVVEAGLAFGTGGHASTRQCLELLQTITPGSLLDIGSGSGVISFAALRLGFLPVTGVDIDPVAVNAAAGNAVMNELAPVLCVSDATDPEYPLSPADVVVANIALRPILRLAERWAPAGVGDDAGPAGEGAAASGGSPGAGDDAGPVGPDAPRDLLLSGLLVEQADEARAAYPGYAEAARVDDGTWVSLHLVRRP